MVGLAYTRGWRLRWTATGRRSLAFSILIFNSPGEWMGMKCELWWSGGCGREVPGHSERGP